MFPSWPHSSKNGFLLLFGTAVLMSVLPAGTASAQRGYVPLRGAGTVGSFDTAVNSIGSSTPGFSDPTNNTTSLTGDKVFVDDVDANLLRIIDTATNSLTSLNIGGGMFGVAISPNGDRVYACSFSADQVAVVDTSTNAVTINFPVTEPVSVAVSPDGTRLYVSNDTTNRVELLDAATGAQIATISGFSNPRDILVTPNGSKLFVVDQSDTAVHVVSTATNAIVGTIPGANQTKQLAITPDGSKVYAAGLETDKVTVIDVQSNTAVGSIDITDPVGVAVTSAGTSLYVSSGSTNTVHQVNTTTDQAAGSFPAVSTPSDLSLVPGQMPTASVTSTAAAAGSATSFDASASTVTGATIARYDWDFGDGTTLSNGGATPQHVYAAAGTYAASVTVTSSDGVSTEKVFNGTQVLRNGASTARATTAVTVPAVPTATLRLIKRKKIVVRHRRSLSVRARSDLATPISAKAYVTRNGRKLKRIKMKTVRVSLKANRSKRLRFRLSKKRLAFLKARLRRGKKLRLHVKASVKGSQDAPAKTSVRLKLPKRK